MKTKVSHIFLLGAAVLTFFNCSSEQDKKKAHFKEITAFEQKEKLKSFAESITVNDLKTHVYTLADDSLMGRKTGTIEHLKACQYISDYYTANNIETFPGLDNHFQIIEDKYIPNVTTNTQNVIGYIEGEVHPDEVLVISAHSDHLGSSDAMIYNGADDNASGTAAIMEIAQAFKTAEQQGFKPKRSILFLHLTAEELGLHGSRYFTQNPILPLKNMVANINIDMVGRVDSTHINNPNYIYVIGADRLSSELHVINEVANETFTNLELDYTYNDEDDPNRYYYRSDHFNFAVRNIPSVFFFNGTHPDYHQQTDTADKINYKALSERSKLIFYTSWYIANSQKRLSVD
ncbi:MAG: peptidase M28 [Bacteroidetes bacterium MedPE-SWsnd-G2]|nr:MAG: peptidase M28 [Bacteroidetes bacterium MedPE-SWsnd-G2]